MKKSMNVTIGFKDDDTQMSEYNTLLKKQFKVSYNTFGFVTIYDVKFVEYYSDEIKLATNGFKMHCFKLKDMMTFEVTIQK